jgi:hypothetical protein
MRHFTLILYVILLSFLTISCAKNSELNYSENYPFRTYAKFQGLPDWCEYEWPANEDHPPPRLNLPAWACEVVASNKLDETYTPSVHLNPFFLLGDFDGDHRTDIAILIKNKQSGESGILIIHRKNSITFIMGAGKSIEDWGGSTNFDWMDMWTVYPKGKIKRSPYEDYTPVLRGDALWVAKSESASVIIFWNGVKYVWYQETD